MKKYLKFIKRERMVELELEDKKMPMTEVIKHTNSLRFIHPGEGNEVSAARTIEPLPSSSAVVYFEAYVKNLNSKYESGVGIIQKDCALKRHPGESNMSIGYLSSGEVYINGRKAKKLSSYKSKSIVGVGIIYSKLQVFFTLDGNFLESLSFEHNATTWPKFYPCVSLRNEGDQIEVRFKNFAFKFESMRAKIEQQCAQQIEKQSIDSSSLYSLVGDYLKFHGYKNTYSKLKQSYNFEDLNTFVEHPFWEAKLHFFTLGDIEAGSEANNQEKGSKRINVDEEIDDQLAIYRRCSTRQRIMSDYWGDILPTEQARKRPQDQQRVLLQSRRKSSVIQNPITQEIENNNRKSCLNEESKQVDTKENERQTFLLIHRIEVLRLIREQKIENALQILKLKLPQIFDVLDYLQAYFHMHIYLRILKNEGANKAMVYMKNQSDKFKNYKDQLYPYHCRESNKLKFVPFSQMMGLVSLKQVNLRESLTAQQFYLFSSYLNELLLKNLGLFPQSRLDCLINHLKCVSQKSEQYQINGLSFICDI